MSNEIKNNINSLNDNELDNVSGGSPYGIGPLPTNSPYGIGDNPINSAVVPNNSKMGIIKGDLQNILKDINKNDDSQS